jgi:uncharacterized protein YfkK (UPF0435 family)
MAFDPDKYLASKTPLPAVSQGFDPDAYLGLSQRGNIINTDVPTVVGEVPNPPVVQQPSRTMRDKLKALYEVPLAAGSAMLAAPVSSAYGVARSIASPQFGTQAGVQQGQQAANQLAQQMTFQPTSPVTQDILQGVSSMAEAAKLPPVLPTTGMLPSYARMAGAGVDQAQSVIQPITQAAPKLAQALRREPQPTMSGVGAAQTPEAVTRMQMAQNLRVPVSPSKGQLERDLAQQQFEIETPKISPELGKPLIEAQAKRNDAILQNFDAYVDATGKESFGLRATGKVVTDELARQANQAKAQINKAYTAAREQGETELPVNYAPLTAYINDQTPTVRSKLAPILDVVNEQVAKNDPKNTGKVSINALEDIYQVINKNFEPNTPAAVYGREMKDIINTITEGQGGEMYQNARRLRQDYSKRFENIGAVDRLLRLKPNSDDRLVAFEDVFQKSIVNGSLDDVKNLGLSLKKGGPQGQQAFKELQGQTIEFLKDKVTQSIDTDTFGNPVVSPAKFKSAVRELDQDGKLDYLFGKKGAQEIRDLMETTIMVNAPLKGAANYSNTSSALIQALDRISASPIGKIPVIGSITRYSFEKAQQKALQKKIEESINYSPNKMADELRKGK